MSMAGSTFATQLKMLDVGAIRVRNGSSSVISGSGDGSGGWSPLEAMRLVRFRWKGEVVVGGDSTTLVRGRVFKNGLSTVIYSLSRNAAAPGEFQAQDEHIESITPDDFLIVVVDQNDSATHDTQDIHITLERAV